MSLLTRELEYFLAICESRNLARAADALGVSQPALTRSLQRLEAHVGAQLFVRAPRGVELTPIGAALRARVDKARITLSDAEREVAQLAAGKVGRVRVGAGHVVARLVSQSLLPRFITERPAAQVQFHVGFNAELFELLEAGALDFAVCGLLETPPNLRFQELLTTDLVVVVRNGHPLTKLRNPTILDLAGFRSAAPSVGVPARQVVEHALKKFGLGDRPHAVETNSWEAILEAVASTDLFSLAPRDEAMRHGWTSRLVCHQHPGTQHPTQNRHPHARRGLPVAAGRAGDRIGRTGLCRQRAGKSGTTDAGSPHFRALTAGTRNRPRHHGIRHSCPASGARLTVVSWIAYDIGAHGYTLLFPALRIRSISPRTSPPAARTRTCCGRSPSGCRCSPQEFSGRGLARWPIRPGTGVHCCLR